jgi:hypothetical protein
MTMVAPTVKLRTTLRRATGTGARPECCIRRLRYLGKQSFSVLPSILFLILIVRVVILD